MREAGNQPLSNGIAANDRDDRNFRRRLLRSNCRAVAAGRRDNVHPLSYKVGSQGREPVIVVFGPAKFRRDVLRFRKAALLQAGLEGGHEIDDLPRGGAMKKTDDRYFLLLGAWHPGPGSSTNEKHNEAPSSHSTITPTGVMAVPKEYLPTQP